MGGLDHSLPAYFTLFMKTSMFLWVSGKSVLCMTCLSPSFLWGPCLHAGAMSFLSIKIFGNYLGPEALGWPLLKDYGTLMMSF